MFRGLLLCLCVFTVGCASVHYRTSERWALAHCLPEGISLDTPLHFGGPPTVEEELLRVGARPGANGQLYTAAGKQIRFAAAPCGGPALSTEQMKAQADQRKPIEEQYCVIYHHFFIP